MKKIKNLRLILGIVALAAGGVFIIIPFIPLGYLFLFVGALLLAYKIPFLRKFMKWIKKKDNSGKLSKAEEKVNKFLNSEDNKKKKTA